LPVGGLRFQVAGLLRHWYLLVPASAAMVMYALVNVEARYVGTFVVFSWIAVYSGVSVPDQLGRKRVMGGVIIALTTALMIAASIYTARDVLRVAHSRDQDSNIVEPLKVAEGLRRMGLQPGDEVAVIGYAQAASRWARLARLRITAELPWQDEQMFWEGDSQAQSRVIDTFMGTGVKAIVAENAPSGGPTAGWQRIVDTKRYVYLFSGPNNH